MIRQDLRRNSPIHANEVRGLDHSSVGTVNPSIPGIHVADLSLHADGANHAPNIVDLVREGVGVSVLPVEVFAADGDREDPVLAVGGDGVEQGLLLRVEVVVVLGPDADEDLHAGVLRGGHGVGESVAVRAGVQANGSDVLGEALQLVEGLGPLGGGLAGSVGVVGADVEALPVCRGEGKRSCEGSDCGCETHCEGDVRYEMEIMKM